MSLGRHLWGKTHTRFSPVTFVLYRVVTLPFDVKSVFLRSLIVKGRGKPNIRSLLDSKTGYTNINFGGQKKGKVVFPLLTFRLTLQWESTYGFDTLLLYCILIHRQTYLYESIMCESRKGRGRGKWKDRLVKLAHKISKNVPQTTQEYFLDLCMSIYYTKLSSLSLSLSFF